MQNPQDPKPISESDPTADATSKQRCKNSKEAGSSRCGGHRRHPHGRKLVGLFLVLGLGAIGFSVVGCHHHGPAHRLAERLDLTDAQRDQATALAENVRAAFAPLHDKREALYEDLVTAVEGETLNRELLKKRLAEVLRDVEQAATQSIDLASDLHATLTPEQREELVEALGDFHAFRKGCDRH